MSIFVDLTTALDTVDHEILLDKLDRYGIRGHANQFFRSFLSDRHQYTVINGVNFTLKDITCGVSRDLFSGHYLFLQFTLTIYIYIYITDIYIYIMQLDKMM